MKIVIMAGGKGTRISNLSPDLPKPMISICGKPILQHQIERLRDQGYHDYFLIIGHLANKIVDYFGDGSNFGVHIEYIIEDKPLGTAGGLYYLKGRIHGDFLLLNGDVIFDVDIRRFLEAHRKNSCEATVLTHPNSHPYDSGIICTDKDGKVIQWLNKEDDRTWYKNRVNAGLHMLSENILGRFTECKRVDLDRDILRELMSEGQLYAYDSPEYVKDMGTLERFMEVCDDLASGKVDQKSLLHKQKAIFLDRDGTINVYKGFLRRVEDMELIDGAAKAIRMINISGYLAIVVTNQPVIARGEVSIEELDEIHNKMETLLGLEGAYLDDIFYCPHHPDGGFDGERSEYKVQCDCRKPKPGLLLRAAEKYNIDLTQSWMLGDTIQDVEAGIAAGCQTALLDKEQGSYRNLLDFAEQELGGFNK